MTQPEPRWATISACGKYRYALGRNWDNGGQGILGFMMLNPSTADALEDDPTIRKCTHYAKTWGYAGLVVVNMFAYRATEPRVLRQLGDWHTAIGPENDQHIEQQLKRCWKLICAWGSNAAHFSVRDLGVRCQLRKQQLLGLTVQALKLTKDGHPAHPLYLPNNIVPQEWAP